MSGFYKLAMPDRRQQLSDAGFLTAEQSQTLADTGTVLDATTADSMIENVVGIFELPIGYGLNFRINDRDYAVPMVVEEPSIVAAVSHAAAVFREFGGFVATATRPVMTGQIQLINVPDLQVAESQILAATDRLIAQANALEPRMVERGGGAVGIEVRQLVVPRTGARMLVVHVHVDVCDAMGANLVNTIAEALADTLEVLSGGTAMLRILTNLTDRRLVRASAQIPCAKLAWQGFSGTAIARGIVHASEFAEADPYRAATHNKGIMNGIDAVAIATGQDWRAIEAGAHSYAARNGQYGPLARWWIDVVAGVPTLFGELELPMAVGIVGGPIRLHPTVRTLLASLDVCSANELACVIASVGLAQNFAAIKALGSTGIQQGHMRLHARSVAATAGATADEVPTIASQMIVAGDIKVARAISLLSALRERE